MNFNHYQRAIDTVLSLGDQAVGDSRREAAEVLNALDNRLIGMSIAAQAAGAPREWIEAAEQGRARIAELLASAK